MIEYLGFFYGLAKDVKDYLSWEEEVKMVDREWLEVSKFGDFLSDLGYKLRWAKPERVSTLAFKGYEVMYEIDTSKRVRMKIERPSGDSCLVLLGKNEG